MRTIGNNPQLSRQTQAVASGAITGGKPVLVNTNGTVSQITGATLGLGSEVDYTTTGVYSAATHDSTNNRLVIAYSDWADSGKGKARVSTVSDISISLGSAVLFEDAQTGYISTTFDSNSNRVVISYSDAGNGNYLTAIVGTVDPSDNSISFGTAVVVQSSSVRKNSIAFDSSNNKVVLSFRKYTTGYHCMAVVGTVNPSNNSISFGTIATVTAGATTENSIVFDSNSNKVVISYDESSARVRVGTVSGTNISFGTAVEFRAAGVRSAMSSAFDSTNNKVLIAYVETSSAVSGGIGKCAVGTVSGTNISFGSASSVGGVVFDGNVADEASIDYNSANQKIVIGYQDSGDSSKGKYVIGTVSGTSISFTGETFFNNGSSANIGSTYDSTSERIVFVFKDGANSDNGTAVALRLPSTNITAESYIGIAEDTVATGQSVTVNTKGAVDENQTSLTAGQTYFVQTTGTLGTSADDPSVVAGTAVTATKLIVKG